MLLFLQNAKSALQSICSTGQQSAYSTVFCFKLGNSTFEAGDPFFQRERFRQNCGVALNKTEGILIWRKKLIE